MLLDRLMFSQEPLEMTIANKTEKKEWFYTQTIQKKARTNQKKNQQHTFNVRLARFIV